ncbi:CobW family GTP-binding protein [Streptomyces palmae]|uniref:GTP-binding protein n=1 Tax=Streptomyces palmae TaxID=1701085 RepID=A0A4Z0H6F6_9ACTN|nr:GTP-binding protein [Streptomyces palmae]TGB08388.1 GTP-binding protein [Streptomyces palmae]
MAGNRIPVVLIAGFLGSGKTTLLNHLLRAGRDTRVGVIVNDFGSINIDALAVAGQVDSMIPIENGCLCCAADASELDAMVDRLARPSAGIDVIVIEASGLAEPQSMIRMLLASEDERIIYGGLVEVVDAAEFDATRDRHPEIDRHLRAADALVLNKTDRMDAAAAQRVLETVRGIAPGTPVVAAEYGRVDPAFLFEERTGPADRAGYHQLSFADLCTEDHDHTDCHEAGGHLHAAYDSVEFTSELPLHPRRFLDLLDTRPAGLYRVKGFAAFAPDPDRRYGLHAVGAFLRFTPTPWPAGEPRRTQLVLIGTGIDTAALKEALAACVEPDPAGVEEHLMLGVLRYVDQPAEEHRDPRDDAAPYED